ncbi:MAG: hypothetical protein ACI9CF_001363, partial [Candidatus Omnitrophota bacterium]
MSKANFKQRHCEERVARDVAISGYYQLCLSGFNARCYTPSLLRR